MPDAAEYQQIIRCNENVIEKFRQQKLNTETLILYSVDNSTIRAFGNCTVINAPLSIYRSWGRRFFMNDENLGRIKSRPAFSDLHNYVRKDLESYWKRKERYRRGQDNRKLKYYQANKIIDLVFKFMPWWDLLDEKTANYIFDNAHVPLDKYSLAHLKENSLKCTDIPNNASMRDVNDSKLYKMYQEEIKRLTGNYPPIVFDLIAQASVGRFCLKPKKNSRN